jgi:hypothetical protein
MTTTYIAVYGNGSWGGSGKEHAADPDTGAPMRNAPAAYANELRYRSLCGQRNLMPYHDRRAWPAVGPILQCRRCADIITRRQNP